MMIISGAKPPGWPQELSYIHNKYQYHASVNQEAFKLINPPVITSTGQVNQQAVVIRKISKAGHPLQGQRGLFAGHSIPAHTWILDYVGEVHCDERPESNYDLSLHRTLEGLSIGIDATKMGNEARFVNDYRGIKERPNCVFTQRNSITGQMRIGVSSTSEPIRKGEELVVSYGKSWWKSRE